MKRRMKMLFYSSDGTEVELVGKEFTQAGIPCEVRNGETALARNPPPRSPEAELWLQDDRDSHRAWMLCVQLGIGFSKRPAKAIPADDLEPTVVFDDE
jgi:hypothetical protein